MHSQMPLFHLTLLAGILASVQAHSWPEALNLIDSNGTIEGPTGYVRNFVPRNATGFKGDETDSFQKTQVVQGAKVCMNRETTQTQSPGYPRLQVSPGSKVALRYAENGHVTIREPGRPAAGGPVYIFGTTDGTKNPLITDVMKWNEQGTGGDKTGKLITTQNFDDGRCYENNPSPLAAQRKAANPIGSALALPNFSGLPCQNDFTVPEDAPVGKLYTIYWVWNFTFPTNTGVEIFSNCLDLQVQAAQTANKNVDKDDFDKEQPAISAAVPSYFAKLADQPSAASTVPQSSAAQSPASQSSLESTQSTTFLGEASNGGVYASAPTPAGAAAVTKTVTVTPSDAFKTIYVMVSPSDSTPGSIVTPTAAVVPSTSGSTGGAASSVASSPTPNSSAGQGTPTTPQSSTGAGGTSGGSQPNQNSPVNNLNIPLLSIGPSGAGRVAMASVAPKATKRSQIIEPQDERARFRRHFY